MSNAKDAKFRPALPPWIRVKVACGASGGKVSSTLSSLHLHTVCEGAKCPNQGECWGRGTATFMVLGARCTRSCRFCAVGTVKAPEPPDPGEPERLAAAAKEMKLSYVVVTSVTRDDLPDGGASHFAAIIRELRRVLPEAGVEVLVPDFKGVERDIATVIEAAPSVFNHNRRTRRRAAVPCFNNLSAERVCVPDEQHLNKMPDAIPSIQSSSPFKTSAVRTSTVLKLGFSFPSRNGMTSCRTRFRVNAGSVFVSSSRHACPIEPRNFKMSGLVTSRSGLTTLMPNISMQYGMPASPFIPAPRHKFMSIVSATSSAVWAVATMSALTCLAAFTKNA